MFTCETRGKLRMYEAIGDNELYVTVKVCALNISKMHRLWTREHMLIGCGFTMLT